MNYNVTIYIIRLPLNEIPSTIIKILFSNQLEESITTMKKLFKAIKNDDLVTIQEILLKRPELISCTAKKPPKADDGQSLLQVALKNGKIRIANYLLEAGADVNFMESPLCENKWRTPVIHDFCSPHASTFSIPGHQIRDIKKVSRGILKLPPTVK